MNERSPGRWLTSVRWAARQFHRSPKPLALEAWLDDGLAASGSALSREVASARATPDESVALPRSGRGWWGLRKHGLAPPGNVVAEGESTVVAKTRRR